MSRFRPQTGAAGAALPASRGELAAALLGARVFVDVTVPRTAVNYSLYGDSVYAVKQVTSEAPKADGKAGAAEPKLVADRRFVKTGEAREDRVVVLSGVAAGEHVVTTGQLKLNPGAAIRIDNAQPLERPEERPKQ